MDTCIDNVLEWYTGERRVTVTFSQKKWANKLRKFAKDFSDVEIISDTDDCIVAHIPLSWVKFSPPRKGRSYTEEEKQMAAARLAEARRKKNGEAS